MSGWALAMIVATTMLMALVLVLRGPVARAFGPHAVYALWALPALRMVMPSLPGWGMFSLFHLAGQPASMGPADLIVAPRMAIAGAANIPLASLNAPAPGAAIPWTAHWPTVLLAVWLGSAVVWFGWQMLRYHRFLAGALRSAELMGRECGIDVLLTGAVDGPVAAGVIRRRIFLPAGFMTRYSAAERRCALLHEAAHHDRHDIAANLVALVVLALHWWNPLAHRAYKAFRADQELACDATVLADMASGERHAYGSAVVKSASARMPGVACALSHKDEIKRRLRNMAAPQLGAGRIWAGAAVAVAAIGAGLVVTASGSAAEVAPATAVASADTAKIRAEARTAGHEAGHDHHRGHRAAQDARREADRARGEAMNARASALNDAAEARQDGLDEAAQARAEAAEERREALREAARDHSEALREAAEARRQAAEARGEAHREIAQARREIEQARNEARREAAEERGQP